MKKNLHIIIISFLFSAILWGSISLSNDYYTTFRIPLKLVDFQKGLTSGTKLPKYVNIKVKGRGWKLISAKMGSESEYVVTANGDTGKKYINLYDYLSDNPGLSSGLEVIDISPDTLSFKIEKLTYKKLKVEPDVDLEFREGYGLATNYVVDPDSIIVNGPVSILNNMDNIPTQKLELKGVNDRVEQQVNLKKLPGMKYSDNNVTLNFDVQRIVDKSIDDVTVDVLNVPKDREVVLLPNKITINVSGGIDILGKLTVDQFKAYVNYRDVVLDTVGGIVPKIESPRNVTIKFIKPDLLRYIIKKFN